MNKEFKRIRNHSIEYFCVIVFFLMMSIISIFAIFSDSFKGNLKVTAIVLTILFSLLLIYLLFLWIPFFKTYRKIKKVKVDDCINERILIEKVSFIYYKAKHYCGASIMKIYCVIDNKKQELYYIFKKDTIFYKDVKEIMNGYIDVEIYRDSQIIKSLGSKLDKKVNFGC